VTSLLTLQSPDNSIQPDFYTNQISDFLTLSKWRAPPSICIGSIEHFFVTNKETQRRSSRHRPVRPLQRRSICVQILHFQLLALAMFCWWTEKALEILQFFLCCLPSKVQCRLQSGNFSFDSFYNLKIINMERNGYCPCHGLFYIFLWKWTVPFHFIFLIYDGCLHVHPWNEAVALAPRI